MKEFDSWTLEIYLAQEEGLENQEEKDAMKYFILDIGLRALAEYSIKIGKKEEYEKSFRPVWTRYFGE